MPDGILSSLKDLFSLKKVGIIGAILSGLGSSAYQVYDWGHESGYNKAIIDEAIDVMEEVHALQSENDKLLRKLRRCQKKKNNGSSNFSPTKIPD